MTFHWPHLLWLLFVPALLAAVELMRRRAAAAHNHPKILRAEAGPLHLTLAPGAANGVPLRLRWRLWLGMILVIVALARPQWGRLDEPVFDQSREIMIALDLSRSMESTDVRPSRLDRAKLLVSSLLEDLRGERVGLIVFSGTAFLQSPLSSDYEILSDFLPGLNPSYMPEGGTNYADLLRTAINGFSASGSADRFLIILSDGEATDDDWKPLVADLKTRGIRVIGLGVGTAAGSMIPDGSGGFVKDERGAVVLSKLDSSTLQELAAKTQGAYADASAWVDIADLLERTVAAGHKGSFLEHNRTRQAERFQWALAPALLLLLWSLWREFPVRPRMRDLTMAPPAPSATPTGLPPLRPPPGLSVLPLLALTLLGLSLLPAGARAAAQATEPPPPSDSLATLVTRLSDRADLGAQDYADFAHATIAYGKDLQAHQQHVPAGPVHDALAAVDEGGRLDPKAAHWPVLRRDLEDLLKKKEPPPSPPKPSPKEKKPEPKNKEPQNQNPQSRQQNQSKQEKKPSPESLQNQQSPQPPPDKKSGFGDMKDHSAQKSDQPPPPQDTSDQQKVGGAQEKKEDASTKDPALAMPLQKLDQLKDQDSPAKLYQLMQGQTSSPKKPGKDW